MLLKACPVTKPFVVPALLVKRASRKQVQLQ